MLYNSQKNGIYINSLESCDVGFMLYLMQGSPRKI